MYAVTCVQLMDLLGSLITAVDKQTIDVANLQTKSARKFLRDGPWSALQLPAPEHRLIDDVVKARACPVSCVATYHVLCAWFADA